MPNKASMSDRKVSSKHPRGVALVLVIVAMSIALALFAIWTRAIVQAHRRSTSRQSELQAVRLAEAGVRRAIALRAANSQYNEGTWSIPKENLGGPYAAEVRILVTPISETGLVRYQATAEYPVGATRRAQVTRNAEIPETSSGTEP
jgi:type II secretory pathway component PulK